MCLCICLCVCVGYSVCGGVLVVSPHLLSPIRRLCSIYSMHPFGPYAVFLLMENTHTRGRTRDNVLCDSSMCIYRIVAIFTLLCCVIVGSYSALSYVWQHVRVDLCDRCWRLMCVECILEDAQFGSGTTTCRRKHTYSVFVGKSNAEPVSGCAERLYDIRRLGECCSMWHWPD